MGWSSSKRNEDIFCNVYFVLRKFLYCLYFISLYILWQTKKHYFIRFFAYFLNLQKSSVYPHRAVPDRCLYFIVRSVSLRITPLPLSSQAFTLFKIFSIPLISLNVKLPSSCKIFFNTSLKTGSYPDLYERPKNVPKNIQKSIYIAIICYESSITYKTAQ